MRVAWNMVAAGAMFGAAVGTTGILAQAPERGKDAQPKRDPDARRPAETAMKPDPAVEAWVKVLIDKVIDQHDTVRDSARAGLVAVGRPALPALQKLAEGDDGAKATAARKLIGEIHGREQRQGGGFGGQPFPGGGGFPDGSPPMPGGGRPGLPGGFNPGQPGQPGQPGPFGGPFAAIERLLPDLKLAEKDLKQVKESIEKAKKETQEVVAAAREKNLGREEIRAAMEKVNKEIMTSLKKVLTEEQFQKIEKAMQDNSRGTGAGGQPGTPRPGRPGSERPPE